MSSTKKRPTLQSLRRPTKTWRSVRSGWGGYAITSKKLEAEGMRLSVDGSSENEARAITESLVKQLNAANPKKSKRADDLEATVRDLLDKCPHAVRDLSGERGAEDLARSLSMTFLGMQSQLAEHSRKSRKSK